VERRSPPGLTRYPHVSQSEELDEETIAEGKWVLAGGEGPALTHAPLRPDRSASQKRTVRIPNAGFFRAVNECPFLIQDVIEKEIRAFIGPRIKNPKCELNETLCPQVVLRILLQNGIEVLFFPEQLPALAINMNNAGFMGDHR
jgi:hypothetical protein